MKQPTLHDLTTIVNKDQMTISLTLAQAMEELEEYREQGDTIAAQVMEELVNALIAQLTPIEE
jgi:DNA helicase TIP49 (TBP-interacting protein)